MLNTGKPSRSTSLWSPFDANEFILLTGASNVPLAKSIAKILKKNLNEPITTFADGEIRVKISQNMRRRHVYIIQPTSSPVNDNLMQLILMVDAARRASASEIIAVIPYFGYSRQDRKETSRVPISSSVVARMLQTAGVNRIFTVDIHAEQEEGFVDCPWDNVYASYTLLPEIKTRNLQNLVVASPDKNGMARATGYAKLLGAFGVAVVYKERDIDINNASEVLDMIGNVKGKNVLLVDDMLDTGGTIVNAANFIKEKGAASIRVAVTHGLFSGPAISLVNDSAIDEVIITDTIAQKEEVKKNKKITIVSVAPLVAAAIERIQTGGSIGKDLILQ